MFVKKKNVGTPKKKKKKKSYLWLRSEVYSPKSLFKNKKVKFL